MSEPVFMAEVPSYVEQSLEQNIISSLAPTQEASQQFNEFSVGKKNT